MKVGDRSGVARELGVEFGERGEPRLRSVRRADRHGPIEPHHLAVPRRSPAYREGVYMTKPPCPQAVRPRVARRRNNILRQILSCANALPDCQCLAAEHSTDSSEIASIDD